MSRFFIDRPIFAWVMAILVMLIGVISVINLHRTADHLGERKLSWCERADR